MDYKEKYEKALERARKLQENSNGMILKKWLWNIFPELKESEDERIKNEIIAFVEQSIHRGGGTPIPQEQENKWIAWLEKQGEQKPQGKSALEAINEEKADNQNCAKPAEWGEDRSKEISLSFQIQAYLNTASDELYAKGKPLYSASNIEDIHQCMLMWQKLHKHYFYEQKSAEWHREDEQNLNACLGYIPDEFLRRWLMDVVNVKYDKSANNVEPKFKDGDVLCYKGEISIYKHDIKNCAKEETTFGGFVYHCCYDGKRLITDNLYSLTEQDKMDVHPATKEQRDTLMKAMADAGYIFDFEKKELNYSTSNPNGLVDAAF